MHLQTDGKNITRRSRAALAVEKRRGEKPKIVLKGKAYGSIREHFLLAYGVTGLRKCPRQHE